jgi:hypothetical protein
MAAPRGHDVVFAEALVQKGRFIFTVKEDNERKPCRRGGVAGVESRIGGSGVAY